MKNKLVLFLMLMPMLSFAQQTEVYVTTKAEFTTAFNSHPGTSGSVTKIIIASAKNEDGSYAQATSEFTLNVGNFTPEATACADGTIIITSNQTDIDNLPHVLIAMNMATQEKGSHFSLVIENISFEFRTGNLATSGQNIYWNKTDCHADSIIFRNCQITNIPRSIVRTVPAQTDGVYNSDNTLNRFVMEGCKVHNMDITFGNNWPLVCLATQTNEVVFKNNMFYNIPYSKQILTWNYCEPTGKEVHVTFENNLVVASKGSWIGFDGNDAEGTFSMIDVGGYLGYSADYNINNNIILTPEENVEYTAWGNGAEKKFIKLTAAEESKILGCTGGLVFASNNVIEGYAAWSAGNNKDEEGNRTWLFGPIGSEAAAEDATEGRIDMATAGLNWSDFYDAHSTDFRLEKSHPLFAQNIGPSIMYVDKFQKEFKLNNNNIYYTLHSDSYKATVIGAVAGLMEVYIPQTIEYQGNNYVVTSIANEAFKKHSMKSVFIPSSIIFIEDNAFDGCGNLSSIVVESGNMMYDSRDNCNAIIKTSNNELYVGCKNSTIPNSVTSLGECAFQNCLGLTSITIPSSVTNIGSSSFAGCVNLSSVIISDIAAWCNIRFGSNPLSYAHHMYLNGEEVKDLVIPNNVATINNYAFSGCSELTSVAIPGSVTSIGENAFSGCTGLAAVYITDLAAWCQLKNGGCQLLSSSCHLFINGMEMKDLMYLIIPDGVASVQQGVFNYCTGLISVIIGNDVTSIGSQAFYECSDITSVTIGSNIKNIGSKAFANYSNLTDVYCLAKEVPVTNLDIFDNSYVKHATLHVPESSINLYKRSEPWSQFGSFVGIPAQPTNPVGMCKSLTQNCC